MPDTALVIIDIQNDYFPGRAMELDGSEAAGAKAGAAIRNFREKNLPVIHVRHLSVRPGSSFFLPGTRGAEIHASVKPAAQEPVVEKNFLNSFRNTQLKTILDDHNIKNLVVAGMMTHMCYKVTLLGDACATRAQSYGGETVPARQVPAALLAALNGFYAKVVNTHEL